MKEELGMSVMQGAVGRWAVQQLYWEEIALGAQVEMTGSAACTGEQ